MIVQLRSWFGAPETCAQGGVLGFQSLQPLTKRSDRLFNLLLGVAWNDVLRAVPIERLEPELENPLSPSFVRRVRHQFREFLVSVKRKSLHIGIDFEPSPPHIIHQEQTGPIVGRKIAGADVLTVAPVVGEGHCSLIYNLEEADIPSTMLNIWPTRFGDRCHVEAVT
ncbi:hypothetical protein AGR7A_Cc10032 [Agrobacterium deltaense NCPPB 1641]|uniref:Uncharacterized protein n=1 Tax=Agrobacterium deltaense NCPPB 1641 TaxID=1183425 RepID=A0A1S7TI99_9HYPH|nr:hypothetical protein AGR7A_Cc10032 [Agrobacterium deltaense NCPPB 1641]